MDGEAVGVTAAGVADGIADGAVVGATAAGAADGATVDGAVAGADTADGAVKNLTIRMRKIVPMPDSSLFIFLFFIFQPNLFNKEIFLIMYIIQLDFEYSFMNYDTFMTCFKRLHRYFTDILLHRFQFLTWDCRNFNFYKKIMKKMSVFLIRYKKIYLSIPILCWHECLIHWICWYGHNFCWCFCIRFLLIRLHHRHTGKGNSFLAVLALSVLLAFQHAHCPSEWLALDQGQWSAQQSLRWIRTEAFYFN